MFDLSKCDRCGDCFVKCQYVDYSRDKAIYEISALMKSEDADILTHLHGLQRVLPEGCQSL
jgi:hypothetical protein